MAPIKDGAFVSKKILLYFYSIEEVCHFIIIHNFSYLLSYDNQYYSIASYINNIIEFNEEELNPNLINIFNEQKRTCDCCGNRTIFKRITNDICHVCYWEDDKEVIYNPNIISDINHISLIEAKRNYEAFGACSKEFIEKVRKPFSYEKPDYEAISNDK